jgi:hypothetical protein
MGNNVPQTGDGNQGTGVRGQGPGFRYLPFEEGSAGRAVDHRLVPADRNESKLLNPRAPAFPR